MYHISNDSRELYNEELKTEIDHLRAIIERFESSKRQHQPNLDVDDLAMLAQSLREAKFSLINRLSLVARQLKVPLDLQRLLNASPMTR